MILTALRWLADPPQYHVLLAALFTAALILWAMAADRPRPPRGPTIGGRPV